jgi:hypothetical protein
MVEGKVGDIQSVHFAPLAQLTTAEHIHKISLKNLEGS